MKRFPVLALCFLAASAMAAPELWVGSYFGDDVQRFDLGTRQPAGALTGFGLDGTLGVTLGSNGNVYVASELTGSVETFSSSTGAWTGTFATAATPTGIAFDSGGNGYVAEFDTDAVRKFDPNGQDLGLFVTRGSGGLNGPDLGLAFGPDGNLYVPSYWTNSILRYDGSTGSFLGAFVTGVARPRQVLWREGKMFVSSETGDSVRRYDATTGQFIDAFIPGGSGGLNGPSGMAFYDGSLFVTSLENGRVLEYDATTGAFKSTFATGLQGPVSLAVVPEPTSLVAVALAGVAMIKRRK